MKKIKYLILLSSLLSFSACDFLDNSIKPIETSLTLNNISFNLETYKELDNDYELYVKGSWDNYQTSLKATKKSEFNYTCTLDSVSSGTYSFYTLINNDENYKENCSTTYTFTQSKEVVYHKINGFINLPVVQMEWAVVNGEAGLSKNTDGSYMLENYNWMGGFALKECSEITTSSYTMSAHFIGSVDHYGYSNDLYMGFVPFYVDNQNYLFCYVQWSKDCRGYIRTIGLTGYIEGTWTSWHDMMGFPTACTTAPNNGFALTLTRTNDSFKVSFLSDDGQKLSGSASVSELGETKSKYFGIYGQNDKVTFSNFAIEEYVPPKEELGNFTKVGALDFASVTNDNTVTMEGTNNWLSGFLVRSDTNLGNKYQVSCDIQGTLATPNNNLFYGLLPWYIDAQNFVLVYLQWSGSTIKSIGMTGLRNGADIGWHDMWTFAGINYAPNQSSTITINVDVANLTIKVDWQSRSETQSLSYINEEPTNVGVWVENDKAAFSNFKVEAK